MVLTHLFEIKFIAFDISNSLIFRDFDISNFLEVECENKLKQFETLRIMPQILIKYEGENYRKN
jgi:hypothetical protein